MENERNKEEKLSKCIVDWENGTQVACNNDVDLARTLHSCTCISVTDNI